jgi:GntR family transcriptional regulator
VQPATWDRKRTLTLQVADWLRDQIRQGHWSAGAQLPSEQWLCEFLDVSRITLRNALMTLEAEGFLVRRHGVGTFVRERLVLRNNLTLICGTTDMIRSMGMEPGIAEIELVEEDASREVALRLGLKEGEKVIRVDRVQTADEERVVVSTEYLATLLLARYPDGPFKITDLRQYILDNLSLYHFIQHSLKQKIHHSVVELRPINAPEDIAQALGVEVGDALMYIEEVDYDIEEHPLLYSIEYHAGEASVFTVNRQLS